VRLQACKRIRDQNAHKPKKSRKLLSGLEFFNAATPLLCWHLFPLGHYCNSSISKPFKKYQLLSRSIARLRALLLVATTCTTGLICRPSPENPNAGSYGSTHSGCAALNPVIVIGHALIKHGRALWEHLQLRDTMPDDMRCVSHTSCYALLCVYAMLYTFVAAQSYKGHKEWMRQSLGRLKLEN
jgi:hypothetical protein